MSRVLDLGLFEEETLDVKTAKGDIIKIKKPTEELALKIIVYQNKMVSLNDKKEYNNEDFNELIDVLRTLTISILNHNRSNIIVDEKYLKDNDIDYNKQVAIITAYTDFMSEITSDPNYKSPQSHIRKKGK